MDLTKAILIAATFSIIAAIPFINLWINDYVNKRDQNLDQWIDEQVEYDQIINDILKSNDIIKHNEKTNN